MKELNYKTSNFQLQKILNDVFELPDLLMNLDPVTKKELLLYLKKIKLQRLNFINSFLILNPTYDFSWCADNISQMFTYNQLNYLEKIIIESIEKPIKNNGEKNINEDDFSKLFNKHGKEFFDYINKNELEDYNKKPTVKFTILT